MLVLTRKIDEHVVIDGHIKVQVLRVKGNSVRIGIEAPRHVSIRRGELETQGNAQGKTQNPGAGGSSPSDDPDHRIAGQLAARDTVIEMDGVWIEFELPMADINSPETNERVTPDLAAQETTVQPSAADNASPGTTARPPRFRSGGLASWYRSVRPKR